MNKGHFRIYLVLFTVLSLLGVSNNSTTGLWSSELPMHLWDDTPESRAHQYLQSAMDRYHLAFDVYTDVGAAGNHFVHRAKMASPGDEDLVSIDDAWSQDCCSGATCIKNTFTVRGLNWGGVYLQNGVLLAGDVKPRDNWGDYPNAGYDLTGATTLTFCARGETGDEQVEFFAFGVGRNPGDCQPRNPYPDSSCKTSTGYQTLDREWKQYTIDLRGLNLSYVIGGFGWVTNAPHNPQGVTFYLDDIRYDLPRPNELRFLVSYETAPSTGDFDTVMRNVAFTYDNALALLAFLAEGDMRRAKLLADAFVYAQDHDRFYPLPGEPGHGRLRNAYQGGDLISPPGWLANGRSAMARMPGWWDPVRQEWVEDLMQVGSRVGDVAWAMIALLSYYQASGEPGYLDAAAQMGEWIEGCCREDGPYGGYRGGYEGWEPNPTPLAWQSTEHNLDLYLAFRRLHELTGDPQGIWRERAEHAKRFVEAMWDEGQGCFLTGTTETGARNPMVPLDIQAWSLLALCEEASKYLLALECAEQRHRVDGGFDFNEDRDGVWYEGTAHMVVAYKAAGRQEKAERYLGFLRQAQLPSGALPAASRDGLTTGLDWAYFNRPHAGATAWLIFAERGVNPYWLRMSHTYLPVVLKNDS